MNDGKDDSAKTVGKASGKVVANPLPAGVPGEQLLVDLTTERVIHKLRLKEDWEEPGGWLFEDVRALVVCAMGDSIKSAADQARADVVAKRTYRPLLKKINKIAMVPLDDAITGEPTPENLQASLIAGIFDESNALPGNLTESAELIQEFAASAKVPSPKPRAFETAKRAVWKRYQLHVQRQAARKAFRQKQADAI